MTSWLSSIKSLKREKRKGSYLLLCLTAAKMKIIVNIPLLRFPMILQHFDLEGFQATHTPESYSEGQLQPQRCEVFLDEHSLMFRVYVLC